MISRSKQFLVNAKTLGSKRFFKILFGISFLFIVLTAILPIWQLLPDIQKKMAIPLHYNIHFGVDLFGPWWQIFRLPIISFVILMINSVIGIATWKKEPVLSYFLFTASAIISLLLFVSMIFVVLINLAYG